MQKLAITVNGSAFEITLSGDYVEVFRDEIAKDLSLNDNNSLKTLLYAFLRKNYEILELKREIENLSNSIDEELKKRS